MFWGVTIQSNKSHREIVKTPFHISMASLVWHSGQRVATEKKLTSVMLRYKGKEFVLCTLEYGRVMCSPLDLVFDKGEQIEFYLMGNGNVHLSGFVIMEYDEEESSENFEEDDDSCLDETFPYSTESESESLVTTATLSSEESPPRSKKKAMANGDPVLSVKRNGLKENPMERNKVIKDDSIVKNKVKESLSSLSVASESNKKSKKTKTGNKNKKLLSDSIATGVNEITQNDFDDKNETFTKIKNSKMEESAKLTVSKSDNSEATDNKLSVLAANSSFKCSKVMQKEKKTVKRSSSPETKPMSTPLRKKKKKNSTETLNLSAKVSKENGSDVLETVDMKVGNGPAARKGKLIHICYVGYLSNGEEFSSVRNRPFSFRLGNDTDVVKGLNSGIEGMKVGGKRKIIVPPSEGYGNKTFGSVPPNSTLTYEVELKAVS